MTCEDTHVIVRQKRVFIIEKDCRNKVRRRTHDDLGTRNYSGDQRGC
jgi:hypothetical protein